MKKPPKVFLDANVFKFATTEQLRLVQRKTTINWGRTTSDTVVHDLKILNPHERIRNPKLKEEASLVDKVAEEIKSGRITAVTHFEVAFETMGLPAMDCERGRFYGAPVDQVDGPVKYSRLIISARHDTEQLLRDFLEKISHPRFDELQKITGAYQGAYEKNLNQMLDAFYVWCAEFERCDYFLTLDFSLIRMISSAPKRPKHLKMVTPSVLLKDLSNEERA